MPTYCYKCGPCDYAFEEYHCMADDNKAVPCPKCNGYTRRDWAAEHPMARRTEDYDHPIHSDSLAMNPNQVAEHRRMFPDIKIDSECRPVFSNYVAHDKYLKACGLVKNPQRIRTHKRKSR